MTGHAKKDHLGADSNFELCIWSECTFYKAFKHTTQCFGSWFLRYACGKCPLNYEKCIIKKTMLKHLLPAKLQHSVFFRVTEYPVRLMIFFVTLGSSFALTELSGRPPEVSVIIPNWRKLLVWSYEGLKVKGARRTPVRHLLMVGSSIVVNFGVSVCFRWSKQSAMIFRRAS